MGFFDRIANLWRGFTSLWLGSLEEGNPEAVYEAAINERIKKHKELKKAVSNIVYLRNKLTEDLHEAERELKEVSAQIPVAVEEDEDDVALVLIAKRDELVNHIASVSEELSAVERQAEEAKAGLLQFKAEIQKLQREKEKKLSEKVNAEARIEIQESLSGLSLDADVKALENVRQSIDKLKAEADIGAELEGDGLDAKLAKIKSKARDAAAQAQLDEMKRQLAARKTASEGAAASVKKTM
ncbi:MAG: PspA/IM30 family protein [Alphaproteobacteria bacterium]|nr:PspA/IM30 family protein [Alphaproteobacteria bacterium]